MKEERHVYKITMTGEPMILVTIDGFALFTLRLKSWKNNPEKPTHPLSLRNWTLQPDRVFHRGWNPQINYNRSLTA